MKLEPACTWSDGPDVAINIYTKSGELVPLDLTADEADELAAKLKACAARARELEEILRKYEQTGCAGG